MIRDTLQSRKMLLQLAAVLGVLLTCMTWTTNAGAAEFTSASGTYPVAVHATSTADVFDVFGSSVQCTANTFTGTLAAKSPSIKLVPVWSNCKSFGTFPTTITCISCSITTTSNGTWDWEGEFVRDVYENATKHAENKIMCVVRTTSQSTGTVSYTNNANGTITTFGNLTNITATQTRNSIFCPAGTHTSTATYTIQTGGIVLTGTTGGIANPIHVK